jgi:hypothetical protein
MGQSGAKPEFRTLFCITAHNPRFGIDAEGDAADTTRRVQQNKTQTALRIGFNRDALVQPFDNGLTRSCLERVGLQRTSEGDKP